MLITVTTNVIFAGPRRLAGCRSRSLWGAPIFVPIAVPVPSYDRLLYSAQALSDNPSLVARPAPLPDEAGSKLPQLGRRPPRGADDTWFVRQSTRPDRG